MTFNMSNEGLNNLALELEKVSTNFESLSFTKNNSVLKPNIDFNELDTPPSYLNLCEDLKEWQRKSRILFLLSVLTKVCLEEGKYYYFEEPFQAGMKYIAVIKKNDYFYLLDEDKDLREIFVSEDFVQFIDDNFWELYEEE